MRIHILKGAPTPAGAIDSGYTQRDALTDREVPVLQADLDPMGECKFWNKTVWGDSSGQRWIVESHGVGDSVWLYQVDGRFPMRKAEADVLTAKMWERK
jgi:hypothetical protein